MWPVDSVQFPRCFETLSSFPNLSQQSKKSNSRCAKCGGLVNASGLTVLNPTGLPACSFERHSGRMLSLTCERSRIRQDYGLGRRQQVSAIRLLSERSDPRVNQRLTSSGSSRRFSYVLFVL